MSHDAQKWPQFNIVPDFSWVCRYDFRILQILWCRNPAVSSKSLDEISQKSQKISKTTRPQNHKKGQEAPPAQNYSTSSKGELYESFCTQICMIPTNMNVQDIFVDASEFLKV